MTIQTNRTRTGEFANVKPEILARATGCPIDESGDIASLYYHTTECYPAQDAQNEGDEP